MDRYGITEFHKAHTIVRRVLERINFMPNWKFKMQKMEESYYTSGLVEIMVQSPLIMDSISGEDSGTRISNIISLDPDHIIKSTDYARMIVEIIYKSIADMFEHEVQEWFKVDGKFLREPHPEREYSTEEKKERLWDGVN